MEECLSSLTIVSSPTKTICQKEDLEISSHCHYKVNPETKATVSSVDFPEQLVITKVNMLYIPLQGLSLKLIYHLKRIASFKNPEFYSRQSLRLSTYNVPRIISCAELKDDYLVLPRGCEDAIKEMCSQYHVLMKENDKTNHGRHLTIQFKGELRDDQKQASNALAEYDMSVLSATTAFGKTVVGVSLIAIHQVNTLILAEMLSPICGNRSMVLCITILLLQ